MKRALLLIIVGALYVLHQDLWFWRTARPLVFGFLPIGLLYHACYTVATAIVMWMLVKYAWPSHLEEGGERGGEGATGRGGEDRRGDEETGRGGDPQSRHPLAPSPRRPLAFFPVALPVSSSGKDAQH